MRTERRRKRLSLVILGLMALTAGSAAAHDLFLKFDSYFLTPNTPARVTILNGTFVKSEGVVARDRIADLSLVGPAGKQSLDTSAVTARSKTSELRLRTGAEGTYALGLSVRPREIALTGKQFNEYLQEEGIEDVLAERTRNGTLEEPAKERYAKHVKAIFQVGRARTETASTVLGYAAEIVPLDNPYGLKRGGTLRVRCTVDGRPAENLVVIAGGIGPKGSAIKESRVRTGADGIASVVVSAPGRWYVKFVKMHRSSLPGITHESQWATLTFQVR